MFRRRKSQPTDDSCTPTPLRGAQEIEALYDRFAHRVHAYALQRLHDPELAADITSITFLRALHALPTFSTAGSRDPHTAMEGWILAIARNAIIDHVRADKHLVILDTDAFRDRLVDRAPGPADTAIADDERARLLEALSHLSATQEQIVLLRLQGWNGAEIAELLQMSHGAVRVAQYRAYARLRELLSPGTDSLEITLMEARHG
jgi:RNA polymerase sigma-70 factor (ECF subfamily)